MAMIVFALIGASGPLFALPTGITSQSGAPGHGSCTGCHAQGSFFTYADPAISGAGTVDVDEVVNFSLDFNLNGANDAAGAGFNLSSDGDGTLAAGTGSRAQSGQLTHSSPQSADPGGDFSWPFTWTAPACSGSYKLYACARPVNLNGDNSGDNVGQCSTTNITVTGNAAPMRNTEVEIPDQVAKEDQAFDFQFAEYAFIDPDADPITYTAALATGGALPGWLDFDGPSRTFSGTPDNGDVDVITVRVTAADNCNTATDDFNIDVENVNDAPNAVNDAFTVDRDSSDNALDVLDNDSDPDIGDTLSILDVGTPDQGGSVTIDGGTSLDYTPAGGFTGTETFTYDIEDAAGAGDTATVTVTVEVPPPPNNAPVAVDDAYATDEDDALVIAAGNGVLANDSDADGDTLTAVLVAAPASGTLDLASNGGFTYTPNANFNGNDSFTYRAHDGSAHSNFATVTLTIDAVNDLPAATNDQYATAQDSVLDVTAPGVLANDTDVDGDGLSAVLASGPTSGTLDLDPDGGFTYTPAAGFNGSASFSYRADDGSGMSGLATVTIAVGAQNTPPVAADDGYTTAHNTPLSVAAPGVLSNDTDADGDALSATLVAAPGSGTLGLASNGGFTYTPPQGFSGSVTFTYQASDGLADSNVATVTVTVNAAASGGGGGGGGALAAGGLLALVFALGLRRRSAGARRR